MRTTIQVPEKTAGRAPSISAVQTTSTQRFADNRPATAVQSQMIQAIQRQCNPLKSIGSSRASVVQRVGGETSGYEGENQNLKDLLQKGRAINKIKKECCTTANKKVLDDISAMSDQTEGRKALEEMGRPIVQGADLFDAAKQVMRDYQAAKKNVGILTGKLKTAEKTHKGITEARTAWDAACAALTDAEKLKTKYDQKSTQKYLRRAERAKKAQEEKAKKAANQRFEEKDIKVFDKIKEGLKTAQVKFIYAPYLNSISLSKEFLTQIKDTEVDEIQFYIKEDEKAVVDAQAPQPPSSEFVENQMNFKKEFDSECDAKTVPPECKKIEVDAVTIDRDIETGAAAYDASTTTPSLFTKKGKPGSEYIKDEFGSYVRRYAYMEKNYWQLMSFLEKGYLSGETQEIRLAVGTETDVSQVSPSDFQSEELDGDDKAVTDAAIGADATQPDISRKIAVAYLHQWKGSGKRQRGVSLASTPKENAVFGNAGESFRADKGAKFKIDLLKVKTGASPNLLINHYALESPTRKAPYLAPGGIISGDGNEYKYDASVLKNRELYLQYVKEDIVESITLHPSEETKTIANLRSSAMYRSYIAGKNGTAKPVGPDLSDSDYAEGEATKQSYDKGLLEAAKPNYLVCADKTEVLKLVLKNMNSSEKLPYWLGFAKGLLTKSGL